MAGGSNGKVVVPVRMTPGERDLLDARARQSGMTRSGYIVERAVYGKTSFKVDISKMVPQRSQGREPPKRYDVHHGGGCALMGGGAKVGGKRRKAADDEVRSRGMFFRASPYEANHIRREAERFGVTVTEYILVCTVYRPAPESNVFNKEELFALWRELHRQGCNLNQIAAATNRIASVTERDGIASGAVDELCDALRQDAARLRSGILRAIDALADVMESAHVTGHRRRRSDVGGLYKR